MEKIRVVTDSGSDIIAPYPDHLTVIPLTIHFGEEEYRDGETIDQKTFYTKLIEGKNFPTTSLIPPGEFEAVFRKAEEDGETVIAIILSGKLSGTYQSACLAAEEHKNVYVIDSLQVTLSEQLLVKYALQMVAQGMPAAQIVAEIESVKSNVTLTGIPDTLEYLHRGGRVSKTVAVLGGALAIKPILKLIDGVVVMTGKARGTKNANNHLIQDAKNNGIDFSKPFCLGYTGLSDSLLQRFIVESKELWADYPGSLPIACVGATIGTHLGPDAVALAYFNKN